MRDALKESGRPICSAFASGDRPSRGCGGRHWKSVAVDRQISRTAGIARETWGGNGVVRIMDLMDGIENYSGPGHWNDPDMLEVGNGGMNKEECRTHFSMWAMWSAPLLAGNDIANMSADTKEILMNKEVIAIDQDPLGQQARRVRRWAIWRCGRSSWRMADGLWRW